MKNRRIICSILVIAMIISFNVSAFGAVNTPTESDIDSIILNDKGVLKQYNEENTKYVFGGNNVEISIPKNGANKVEMVAENIKPIKFCLPEQISEGAAKLTENGTILYNADKEGVMVGIQVLKEQFGQATINYVRSKLIVTQKDKIKPYVYKFDLPRDYRLIKQSEFQQDNSSDELIYIIDSEGTIVNTIEMTGGEDSKGNPINVSYDVINNSIIQEIVVTDNTEFPVNIVMSSYGPINTANYVTMMRTSANALKAMDAEIEINARQSNTLSKFCSIMTTLFSFLPGVNQTVSYTVTFISSVLGGVSANLERQENMYSLIHRAFTTTATNTTEYLILSLVRKVVITYPLYGTYQGKNKGYVYQQKTEYATFYDASGQDLGL